MNRRLLRECLLSSSFLFYGGFHRLWNNIMTLVFTIVEHARNVRCAHVWWRIIPDIVCLINSCIARHMGHRTECAYANIYDDGLWLRSSLTCCQIWCERWISKFSSGDEYRVCMHQTVLHHLWQIVGTFPFHSNPLCSKIVCFLPNTLSAARAHLNSCPTTEKKWCECEMSDVDELKNDKFSISEK